MRITGGELAGRRLRAPRGLGVRPTADRVRESVFAWLGRCTDARVLDLYAGTGALGLEALSRGASNAVFVERSASAARALRENLQALGLAGRGRLRRAPVRAALRALGREGARFDLVLLDPPYAAGEAEGALAALLEAGVLAPEGRVVLECDRRHPPGDVPGLAPAGERRYGETLVRRFERAGDARAGRGGPEPAGDAEAE